MTVTLTVENLERRFTGTYDELHNLDWASKIQSMLDDKEEEGRTIDAAFVFDTPLNKFLGKK